MTRLIVGVACGLLLSAGSALGTTFRVPEDYASIQEAINLASPSQVDSVVVGPGHYIERLYIRKALVLRGSAGAALTTIDGQRTGNVITMNGVGRNCIIEDLTLTGGGSTDPDSVGAALYLNQYASPIIQRCRLVDNAARAGGGVNGYVYCEPLIRDCWISDNDGGAIVLELNDPQGTTWAEVTNTVIVRNHGFAVKAIKGARVWIRRCTLADNAGDGVRSDEFARVRVQSSIVSHNQGCGVLRLDATVCFYLQCNDVWGNAAGNYVGSNPNDSCFPGRGSGDVSFNPCFQNPGADNYHLHEDSPLCALQQPGACGALGAYDDPCSGSIVQCVDAIEPSSWSGVKQLFR
jgi:hypothetical protein